MANEQQATLDAILRQSAFPADAEVDEQRRLLRALLSAQPLPGDVTVTAAQLGEVPVAEITVDGIAPRHVVLHFHGGVYVMGDAALAAELASQVARRTQARAISVDYRLAPEHPYPAAVDDALAAYEALLEDGISPPDIVFTGESAGGGLAVAPGPKSRGPPRRRRPPGATSSDRRCRGHARDHASGAPRLPGLPRDSRRRLRGAGPSRTAPVSTSRRRSSMTPTEIAPRVGKERAVSGGVGFEGRLNAAVGEFEQLIDVAGGERQRAN